MPTLIINSDDFGISRSINIAIARSFEAGLISSTTLMANMPGFDDAVERYHTNHLIQNRVGLHINLTEGIPLTEAIRKCGRFCDREGRLVYIRTRPIFRLSQTERIAVYDEIKAQIEKLIAFNIRPTHFDGHQHVHTEAGIAPICLRLAREFGVRSVRLTKNIGRTSFLRKAYKIFFNFYLRRTGGLLTTDYFCGADDFRSLMDRRRVDVAASYEVMVHSRLDANDEIVDLDGSDLRKKIVPIISEYEPVSYGEFGRL